MEDLLGSYEYFVGSELPRLLEAMRVRASRFEVSGERSVELRFGKSKLRKMLFLESDGDVQKVLPSECRARKLTYSLSWYADISVRRSHGRFTTLRDAYLGRIPCMLGSEHCWLHGMDEQALIASGECPFSPMGFFVVGGVERSLIMQKSHTHNHMIVYARGARADLRDWTCAVKCDADSYVRVTQLKMRRGEGARVLWPKLEVDVALCSLLEHLGCSRLAFERSLTQSERDFFAPSLDAAEEPIRPANTFMVGHEESMRVEELLRHLLPMQKRATKSAYLILMCKHLYKAVSDNQVSDRDSLEFSRVESISDLMSSLLYQLLRRTASSLKQYLHKLVGDDESDAAIMRALERCTVVTDGLQYAFSTGIWDTTQTNTRRRVGVAQLLQRANTRTMMSQLRRLSSTIPQSQKVAAPRYLHPSTFGRVCCMETPEGNSCGLELQLCHRARVSLLRDPAPVFELLRPYVDAVVDVSSGTAVFLNGRFIGCTSAASTMVEEFRAKRRAGAVHAESSIAHQGRTVHVRTSAGRILRPLRVRGPEGFAVEMIDFHEEKTMTVSLDGTGDACEVDPGALFGYGASLIPFSCRLPTPRSTYQASMQKQAVSVPCLSFDHPLCLPTTQNVFLTAQRPIVYTRSGEESGAYDLPAAINAIVAVVAQRGYNQEDAIVVSKAAVDRGMGLCVQMRVQSVSMSCAAGEAFSLERPPGRPPQVTETVGLDGLPLLNTPVKKGQCLLGRVKRNRGGACSDASLYSTGEGRVHRVVFSMGRGGAPQISVQVREWKPIEVGDKLASRSAQKGCVSQLMPQEDMPFTLSGMVPDLMINPAAFPSRMTASQLLEGALAKVSLHTGRPADGSPFQKLTAESLGQELLDAGFSPSGEEVLFDGRTGERLSCKIFLAPVSYQRLKHFAKSKLHARSTGRRNMITRQPSEGRSHAGGLRFGEMERDCMIAHSAPCLLQDTFLERSDGHLMRLCRVCGDAAGLRGASDRCVRCGRDDTTQVRVPYAYKLLMQELMAMGIRVQMRTST